MPIDTAEKFRLMATAIERNAEGSFGGAFVVVPPPEAGEPLETLILDTKQDPAQFWMLLKTKCDLELAALDAKQRQQATFGGRR
ncbi:MAG: hypothetical protein KGL39_17325 [Patescibacteria group bacterium]|nr:hypothetical protein [Patescibacteria group bacterium]